MKINHNNRVNLVDLYVAYFIAKNYLKQKKA